MAIGYPIGGVIGGSIASMLLATFDWRAVFYFGTLATALFIPLVWFVMPESVHWLARRQPSGALDKINGTFRRLGHASGLAYRERRRPQPLIVFRQALRHPR